MNMKSAGGSPSLQGIDIGSPYKAVTVSVAQAVTQTAADCYSSYTYRLNQQSTTCMSSTTYTTAKGTVICSHSGQTKGQRCFYFHSDSRAVFDIKEDKTTKASIKQ